MIILSLIHNVALLIALMVVLPLVQRGKRNSYWSRFLTGLIFAAVGIVGMMAPVVLAPGIIFDGRSIILSVAGLFGGPLTAAVAAIPCAAYRLYIGGDGAGVGLAVIAESTLVGLVFHYVRRRYPGVTRPAALWGFGLIVHVIMIVLVSLLPSHPSCGSFQI